METHSDPLFDLPQRVREIVEQRLGPVTVIRFHEGQGSDLTATLSTSDGPVFLKVISLNRPRAELCRIEPRVQSYLVRSAPRMLWHAEADSWLLMCFEHVDGRQADISPGSSDLPRIAQALHALSLRRIPRLPVLPIQKRWALFAPPGVLGLLSGDTLVHTDLAASNILVGDSVRFVDWAWPTTGAAWLDTALMIPRFIQAGHTPEAAEAWAELVPAWHSARREAIDGLITARLVFAERTGATELHHWLRAWRTYRSMNDGKVAM